MTGTITYILSRAGWRAMNGPLADERRRLAGAEPPAAYVSYDPRLLAGAGWYGYRIALKGGDRQMVERARYMLSERYVIRDGYEYYADGVYVFGVLLRQRVPHYGIGGGAEPGPSPIDQTWLYFTMPDGGTVTLTKNGSPTVVTLEYSLDNGATWTVWTESGNVRTLILTEGQTMHIRNTSATSTGFNSNQTDYYNFSFIGFCYSGGNLMSLLCVDPTQATMTSYCFYYLFRNCNTLVTPADLSSITTIANRGFGGTYWGCTSLVSAADMPSLITINENGCANMYRGCSSLISAASMPSVTTIASSGCYFMYYQCTLLVSASYIPLVTTVESYAFGSMYYGCMSLVNAQDMSSVTTVNQNGCRQMYQGCTSLENASDMSSITTIGDNGFYNMFFSCLKISRITINYPVLGNNSLNNWLYGVSLTGDFYCSASLTIPTGASGIPSGWTRHDI